MMFKANTLKSFQTFFLLSIASFNPRHCRGIYFLITGPNQPSLIQTIWFAGLHSWGNDNGTYLDNQTSTKSSIHSPRESFIFDLIFFSINKLESFLSNDKQMAVITPGTSRKRKGIPAVFHTLARCPVCL